MKTERRNGSRLGSPARWMFVLVSGLLASCSSSEADSPQLLVRGEGAFGDACTATEDCESLLCVREDCESLLCVRVNGARGVCSRTCSEDVDCPPASNWICTSPTTSHFKLCACEMSSPTELCGDGLDNDCDGKIDDCLVCAGKPVPPGDPLNCGQCGKQCRADQVCQDGACTCSGTRTECDGACVDTTADDAHCGACQTACLKGQTCTAGTCRCEDAAHPDWCAEAGCVDTNSDPAHCGGCGHACPSEQNCDNGACVCPAGGPKNYCPAVGCVNLQDDEKHCGSCTKVCGAGQACVAGECQCPAGLPDYCPGQGCLDLSGDPAHCGNCDTACATAQLCKAGACTCPSAAPNLCPGAGCVDLEADEQNCGACGLACSGFMQCNSGVCECPVQAPSWCGSSCSDLLSDEANCGACGLACSPSQTCSSGKCVCPSSAQTACGSACADLLADELHCGACGHGCLPGEYCQSGQCQCATGLYCDGLCISASDTLNCGQCGLTCGTGQSCSSGTCKCSSPGLSACGTACVDLKTDEANCGSCGLPCKPGEQCTASVCACPSGQKWCVETGACTAIASDKQHCGACGHACPGDQTCSNGVCICPLAGTSYCGSVDACVNKASNPAHCGSCDKGCSPTQICSYGACKCPASGQQYCPSAGACVDTVSSGQHCGVCDQACPATATCLNGKCGCNDTSLTVCDGACVDTKTHHEHCGGCGKACPAAMQCVGGTCLCPTPPIVGPTRLTTLPGAETQLYAAGAGDKIGVVYLNRNACTAPWPYGNLRFTLIDSKGLRLQDSDVQLTQHDCVASYAQGPDIVWNGKEFGVVWTETFKTGTGTYQRFMMFQRIDASGAMIGTAVNLTTSTPGGASQAAMPESPRMSFMPGVGYAVVTGKDTGTFDFQRLGLDGTQPEPAVTQKYTFWPGACTLAASDKFFGLLAEGSYDDDTTFFKLGPDGTLTSPSYPVAKEMQNVRPQLFSMGDSWLSPQTNSGYYDADVFTSRGPELQYRHTLFNLEGPVGTLRASLDADILSISLLQGSPARIPVYRYRIPQDAAAAPVPVGARFEILSTPNGAEHALVNTSAKTLVSIWLDTRYGDSELFSASADVSGCP